jgi:hypothetical protein
VIFEPVCVAPPAQQAKYRVVHCLQNGGRNGHGAPYPEAPA